MMTAFNLVNDIKTLLELSLKDSNVGGIYKEGVFKTPTIFIGEQDTASIEVYPFIAIHTPDIITDSNDIIYKVTLTIGSKHEDRRVNDLALLEIMNLSEYVGMVLNDFPLPKNEFKKDENIEIKFQAEISSSTNSFTRLSVIYKRMR